MWRFFFYFMIALQPTQAVTVLCNVDRARVLKMSPILDSGQASGASGMMGSTGMRQISR
jgi:hypothetical protein